MERFADAFHEIERAVAVDVKCADVYVEDIKAAKDAAMPIYDTLRAEPEVMKDGKVESFTRRGFKEVVRHAADRRVLASFVKMRELAGKAVYLGAAPNSQKNVLSKVSIKEFHYYLTKGKYLDFAEWREQRGETTKVSGDAYVVIVVAEGENRTVFYDLDATDVEEVENNKGVSDILDAGRVPNPGRQDSSTPKGRIYRFKEYVNHIDAVNAEIDEKNEPQETPVTFSMRTKEEPKKKGIGYKVFFRKDGKLYPPMVANPGGEDTPVGVWLDADEGGVPERVRRGGRR